MTSSTARVGTRRLPVACVLVVMALLSSACGAQQGDVGTTAQADIVADSAIPQDADSAMAQDADAAVATEWAGEHCARLAAPVALAPRDRPTAALSCGTDRRLKPGDGEWTYAVTSRATEGLDSLLVALRLPSEPDEPDVGCRAILIRPQVVVLEIEGAPRAVSVPLTVCQHPLEEVQTAYEALRWMETSQRPLAQVRGEAAVAAGCESWKDEISNVSEATPGAAVPPAPALPVVEKIAVCSYRSEYPPGWKPPVNGAGEVVDGVPLAGGTLAAAASDSLIAALAGLPPAQPCSVRHERFAVLRIGTEWVSVELDGCRRVLMPGPDVLRQGSPALTALLAEVT